MTSGCGTTAAERLGRRSSALPPSSVAAGYGRFCPRRDLAAELASAAEAAKRKLALGFVNTIEHNERNYRTPWRGREAG